MEKEHLFPIASPTEGEAFADDMQGNQSNINGPIPKKFQKQETKTALKGCFFHTSFSVSLGYRMIALLLFFH